ncbi:MAG: ribosomal protein S18-alanine N-acetyltransferase [Hespellia sp.]|nr:ribosomal protein S18-alanine N-acetyltransferase [Hespellia sp.]
MIQTRKMKAADIEQIVSLEAESFPDPWSETSITDSMEQNFSLCLVAEDERVVVGYLIFYRNLDEGEILRIAVKSDHRRAGVGTMLLGAMRTYCEQKGIKRVLLDVRSSNKNAKKFYKKQGFAQDGMRKHFYSKPDEDAILMSRRY